ncbi:phospholipase d transphosphatidylase [Lasius niger]|uniref:Phospholipase d transphosphatidylase n=1 Tax=Lasius niger TaxID=67767 RepID=A0A0J7JV05_LASNI|nr:phospholipase d transphosphatidylase [Lasius niger]
MHGLGGIADQHRAFGIEPLRLPSRDRITVTATRPPQAAQPPAKALLRQFNKILIIECGHRGGLGGRNGQHQAATSFGQGQQGHGTHISETLPGTTLVRTLGRNRANE